MIWYWDAVVMWFFHAKVIAFANEFSIKIYDSPPYPAFIGYPKMLPVFAALISEITGVYNEALPKSVLSCFLFGVMLGMIEVKYFTSKEKIFIYFILLSLMGIHSYSGYMDGWLAIYTTICSIFLVNLKKDNCERDASNAICTIGLLPMMKLEGTVISIVLLLFLVIGNYKLVRDNISYLISLAVIFFTPSLTWVIIKAFNDFHYPNPHHHGMIERLLYRLMHDFDIIIYYHLVYTNLIYILIMTIFICAINFYNKKIFILNSYVWIPLGISLIYLILVIGISLIDNSNLTTALEVVPRRITLPIMMMIFVFNLIILKEKRLLIGITFKKKDLHI